jgi:hypothetical protein
MLFIVDCALGQFGRYAAHYGGKIMDGLEEFKAVVTDFSSVASNAAKLAVIFPLADLVLQIGPPFPRATPFITSLVMLFVLMLCFHFGFGKPRKKLNRLLILSFLLLSINSILYFTLYSTFVDETTCGAEKTIRQVKGYALNSASNTEIKAQIEAEERKDSMYTGGSGKKKKLKKPKVKVMIRSLS